MRRCQLARYYTILSAVTALVSLCLAACNKPNKDAPHPVSPSPAPTATVASAKREWGDAKFDVCALLTKQEVKEIVGTDVGETKSAGGLDGSIFISQCFYLTPQHQVLVLISVAEKDLARPNAETIRDRWKEMFEPGSKGKREEEEEEEGRDRPPPEKIEGLGDEAYWHRGALNILKGERFIRVSVTESDLQNKLSKSKLLAQRALRHL